MNLLYSVCGLLAALAFRDGVDGHGPLFYKLKNYYLHKQLKTMYRDDPPANVTTDYITQPLDHFDALLSKTYKQRYHTVDAYWSGPDNGPVFLYIGGEGPLDAVQVNSGHHLQMAITHRALIFGVEHRYYGESVPEGGISTETLHYLSSQQALADLASFIGFATEKYALTKSNIWISIGGSYPGSLSAWMNLKYPHLIYGALASSAPVRAQVDFQGYNDVVRASIGNTDAGGSPECINNISTAFATVDKLVRSKQLDKLQKDFDLCGNLTSNLDMDAFLSTLQDGFMGAVQYNRGWGSDSSIAEICDRFMATPDPYENLIQYITGVKATLGLDCVDASYKFFRDEMEGSPQYRAWIYQTCSQFGYYQTCESDSQCPFAHELNLTISFRLCHDAYGITRDIVYRQANFTNEYYGSDHPKGGRILFINGSIDPWHSLSVLKSLGGNETAIFIQGTSHCQDMSGNGQTDVPSTLAPALKEIEKTVAIWISEATQGS